MENASDDWINFKHMPIDNLCMETDLKDIKIIVNKVGVLEIMDYIQGQYGDDFIAYIMQKPMDMRYRNLFYHILNEYIDLLLEWFEDSDDESDSE
jgi:hypothetical protein